MKSIPVVRATVRYIELPGFVLIDEMPPAVHAKVLAAMGDDALDIHDDAIAFPHKFGPGAKRFMEALGVTVVAEAHKGIMVCLYPPKDVAKKFAVEGGEPVENMHVTLGYLGKIADLPEDAFDLAIKACESVAKNQVKLEGSVGGVGRWAAGDDGDCIYASVDVPGSNDLQAKLCEALEAAGIPARSNHGWSAHMTIQYLEPDLDVKIHHVEPVDVSFDSVWVVSGDEDRKEIKFGSNKAEAWNVTQRRRITHDRAAKELSTILDNARDKVVTEPNVKKVIDMTGLNPTKAKDYKVLREKLEVSPLSGVTSALDRQIQNKLGWW